MTNRRTLLKAATAAIALSFAAPVSAETPMPVVATFSILGDMVERVGGEHVALTTLVGPEGDTHVYQPTPADARAVSEAQLLIVNGLEFEGWLDRLVDASDFKGTRVVATDGVDVMAFEEGGDHDDHDDHHDEGEEHHKEHADGHHDEHEGEDHDHDHHDEHEGEDHEDHAEEGGHHDHHHGAFDPHAWQSLTNAVVYVDNITAALSQADPANAADYYANRAVYVAELEALDTEIREMIGQLPEDKRSVVTSHDAFQYFGKTYGLNFMAPQGLSTESEASAKGVAELIEHIREDGISAVFIESITDPRLLEQIANETGASIGGILYTGALSGPDGPAATYLDMMRHNATTLTTSLGE